ncbi:MAG: hypothetical protein ACU84Q_17145, partial [Gammaproteobacteria bacterium]
CSAFIWPVPGCLGITTGRANNPPPVAAYFLMPPGQAKRYPQLQFPAPTAVAANEQISALKTKPANKHRPVLKRASESGEVIRNDTLLDEKVLACLSAAVGKAIADLENLAARKIPAPVYCRFR